MATQTMSVRVWAIIYQTLYDRKLQMEIAAIREHPIAAPYRSDAEISRDRAKRLTALRENQEYKDIRHAIDVFDTFSVEIEVPTI